MQYTPHRQLSMDEEFILTSQVLPIAKDWVMNYKPSTSLHQQGIKTLQFWNVKDAELRRRMEELQREGRA